MAGCEAIDLGQVGNGLERSHKKASACPLPRNKDCHVANGRGSPDTPPIPELAGCAATADLTNLHDNAGERPDPIMSVRNWKFPSRPIQL